MNFIDPALDAYCERNSGEEAWYLKELAAETHEKVQMPIMLSGHLQGRLLSMLSKLVRPRIAVEIGTYTGYSARAVAVALPPDGRLLACDISDEYTRVGRPFWREAGVEQKIELVLAPARQTLDKRLAAGEAGAYDFAFIDADKSSYDDYYERCLKLVRPGGLILFDNTLWDGQVARPARDADTAALQALNDKLHRDERVEIALLTVGDGLTLAHKRKGG